MIVLSFSILMALIFTIIVHFFYAIDIVYTHIFYIPIILAAMWYPKKALSLAIFLGSLHITFAYISMGSIQIPSLLRAIILLLVAYVTSQVALKKERLTKEHQKIHEEMEKAWYIHRHTLPKNIPEIEGISISAYYQPAAKIGGDAYDIIPKEDRLIFYLADVSGHGLDSSMLSLFVKHTIKGFLNFTPLHLISPSSILTYLIQEFIREDFPEEYFICIFLGILHLEKMELFYEGMGFQDTPYVKGGKGDESILTTRNFFISSCFPQKSYHFQEKRLKVTPKTTILFNTDGLTEVGKPGAYYRDRIKDLFYKKAHLSPAIITKSILEDFSLFNQGSPQGSDDITFLILQINPEEEKKPPQTH